MPLLKSKEARATPTVVDSTGNNVRVGAEVGRGGEGTVFGIDDVPTMVAKIYHEALSPDKSAKLSLLARTISASLTEIAAWPASALHRVRGGPVVGITMARVTHHVAIHELYSPSYRKRYFPDKDWAFLIHAARNVASAFEVVHREGHVVGDVNESGIMVSKSATIKLIDCDSFQIRDGQRWFLCDVGVADYTPPELHGQSFTGVTRTANHDAFGLAVIIFRLLFMGRHPFAGRYAGTGDMPIEKAIAELRFAFGRHASVMGMAPPPHALALSAASVRVGDLFERAFSREGMRDNGRPSATEWREALDTLRSELRACTRYSGHKFHASLTTCPWCAMEAAGGPDMFISVNAAIRAATGFDLQTLWEEISRVQRPEVDASFSMPVLPAQWSRVTRIPGRQRALYYVGSLGWVIAVLVLILPMIDGSLTLAHGIAAVLIGIGAQMVRNKAGITEEKKRRRLAVNHAEASMQLLQRNWLREVTDAKQRFGIKLNHLHQLRAEYHSLDSQRLAEQGRLVATLRERQLARFLERYYIKQGNISGIGKGRVAMLASYGIETAADVRRSDILQVPGFGNARTEDLMRWRRQCESMFVFNAALGVDAGDVADIDKRFNRRRNDLETMLTQGLMELRRISSQERQRRETFGNTVRHGAEALAQAKAALSVF
jgi:DNA-binding helix-hairpin-helix protein with protein kinase domain